MRTRLLFCWPSLSDSATACGRRFAASRRERRSPPAGAVTQLLAFPGFKPSVAFPVSGSSPARGLFIRTSLPDGRTPGKFQIVPARFGNREAPILRAGAAVGRRSSGYPRRTRLFCNRTLQPNSATERKESMPFYFGTCKSFTQYSPQTPFRLCGYRRTHRPDGFSAGKGAARTENTGVNRRISAFIFSSSIPVRLRP